MRNFGLSSYKVLEWPPKRLQIFQGNTVFLPVFLLFKNSEWTTRCKPALYDEILIRQFNSTKRAHMIIMYSRISIELERALSKISRIFLNLEMVQYISRLIGRTFWEYSAMSHRHRLISKTESIRIWSIELGKAVSTLRIVLLKDASTATLETKVWYSHCWSVSHEINFCLFEWAWLTDNRPQGHFSLVKH